MKLSAKHKLFIAEYIKTLNAGDAAEAAGYCRRYSCVLLSKPIIKEALAEAVEQRTVATQIDANWILRRLAEEADADVADLYDESHRLKPVKEWPLIWRKGLVSGVKTLDGGGVVEVKLSDRTKRLELIGKHINVGAFSEKHEHTGPDGGPIKTEMDLSKLSDDQLKQLAGIIAAAGGSPKGD